jgi:hypothetical protein
MVLKLGFGMIFGAGINSEESIPSFISYCKQ